MTDTFAPEAPPPGPLPTMPPGVPTGQAPVALPPDPAAILQAMVAGAKKPQLDSGVSARDRLLLGPKVRSGDLTPKVPETAPEPDVLAQQLTGIKPGKQVNEKLVNVAARMAQVRAASPDPDKAAANWKRVSYGKHLLPESLQNKFTKLMGGDALPEDEWSELSMNVDKTAEAIENVADDWTVGSGQVKGIDPRPDGVYLHVSFPDTDDIEKLPDSLTGDSGSTLPSHTLAKEASAFDVFVGPSDVTYAAKPTVETDFAIRAEFPGPIGSDGVPRWTKVAPLPITDHAVIQSGLAHEPLAVVESFADPEAYCGVHPGDYIVFDVPDKKGRSWQAPSWAKGVYPLRAGVARSAPEFSYAPIGKEDIPDVSTAYDRLEDTSWAVLDVEPGRLSALGLKPFEVRRSDGGTAQLVFGAVPRDLEDLTDGPIYTAEGILGDDADEELPSFSFLAGNGTVAWAAEDGDASGAVSRVDRRARRMAWKVDPNHAGRITQLASDFEVSGASNVAIYSRQAKLDGFEPARERLFSDGVSLKVVRTADPVIGDPHAIPVHVRSTAGLPKGRVPIDPERIVDAQGVEPGGKIRIPAGDDLAEATRQAAVMGQKYGYDKVVLDTPDGEVRIFEPS